MWGRIKEGASVQSLVAEMMFDCLAFMHTPRPTPPSRKRKERKDFIRYRSAGEKDHTQVDYLDKFESITVQIPQTEYEYEIELQIIHFRSRWDLTHVHHVLF